MRDPDGLTYTPAATSGSADGRSAPEHEEGTMISTTTETPPAGPMRAITQSRYGSPDVLRLEQVDRPVATGDQILVRVHAASLNRADDVLMRGEPYVLRLASGLRTPKSRIRGRDVAGVVEAVGDGVTRFHPGDAVYGEIETGSFAEYAVAPEGVLGRMPTNLTFVEAAAIPLAAGTALQALRDAARVEEGRSVLINGASGGVGTFAIQIAKALGADVTAVCSARNATLARSLGADRVVDYRREDFAASGERFDAILDLVGNRSLRACRRVLAPGGVLVLSSGTGHRLFGPLGRILRAAATSPFVGQELRAFMAKPNADDLCVLTTLVEDGRLRPVIQRTHPLDETPLAFHRYARDGASAKIVIAVR